LGLILPHILLANDYHNGRMKVPGGKRLDDDEPLAQAMNRKFREETGLTLWQFEAEDLRFRFATQRRECYFFLKIILVDPMTPELWRPLSRPDFLGATAGLSWMPISSETGSFPHNMMGCLFELGYGLHRYINHDVIWSFCEILCNQYPQYRIPRCPLRKRLDFDFDFDTDV
jgi:ADP-ribose pyrophosphatase YjhB (NUDIX family)